MYDIIKKMRNIEIGEGTSDSIIREYESELTMFFPEDYKSFLRIYGFAKWSGHYITGVSEDEDYDVLESTKYEISNDSDFPPLSISLDTDFIMYCEPSAKAGQIHRYPIHAGEGKTVFRNFSEFLKYKTA